MSSGVVTTPLPPAPASIQPLFEAGLVLPEGRTDVDEARRKAGGASKSGATSLKPNTVAKSTLLGT